MALPACEIVFSKKGREKLSCDGYLYTLRRTVLVRDDSPESFYWRCEDRSCKGTAVTIFRDCAHLVKKVGTHTCGSAMPARAGVVKCLNEVKLKAKTTADAPCKIVQDVLSGTSMSVAPYLGSKESLKKIVKRARSVNEKEPTSLENVAIPNALKRTLSGENFLIKHFLTDGVILLFTTVANIVKLGDAQYWVMDGTFKVVPPIFRQLYTIHAPVGPDGRSRLLPLVYALMSRKSVECYSSLFSELTAFASSHGTDLEPTIVITDYEIAAMNACTRQFPNAQLRGCFFHLTQCIYRKISSIGLKRLYSMDETFSLKMRQIAALAFLSPNDVSRTWPQLKAIIPAEGDAVVNFFEETYIEGRIRRLGRDQMARCPPLFPPSLWSVFDRVDMGIPRTQNKVEAWHRRFETLVGSSHVGVYKLIKELQKEQRNTENDIECILRGDPCPRPKAKDLVRENRLLSIFSTRSQYRNLDYLRAIAHNLRF